MHSTMASAPKRQPSFTTDHTGKPLAVISLSNGKTARLDPWDWEALLQRGLSPNWTLNTAVAGFAYVRAKANGQRTVQVAREIVGALPGQIVGYRNGDRTDLCRANLTLSKGGRAKPRAATGVA